MTIDNVYAASSQCHLREISFRNLTAVLLMFYGTQIVALYRMIFSAEVRISTLSVIFLIGPKYRLLFSVA